MSEITRLQELKTQAVQSCLNAMTNNQATIMTNHGIKTSLSVEEGIADTDVITQESVWMEPDGTRWRYRTLVAVMVERESA